MRADRLVSIMMLLQKSRRITAESLAEELEVSERTIYRDIDALGIAGVPVYTQRGPGGGIALLESYRTELTGLTASEVQALLALSVPAPLFDLGIGADLGSALRKVAAAVPATRRESSSRLLKKFFIDSSEWTATRESKSIFEIVRKALWDDWLLSISYYSELGSHAGTISAIVQPYGLIASAGSWYLVAGCNQQTMMVPLIRIHAAQIMAEKFAPPQDFHLESFWHDRVLLTQLQRPSLFVLAHVKKAVLPLIEEILEGTPEMIAGEGWFRATLRFETLEEARTWLLGFGNAIEVVEPLALRLSIRDYAQQILSLYGEP